MHLTAVAIKVYRVQRLTGTAAAAELNRWAASYAMHLPTVQDINPVPEDLDGQTAVRNFHGKSLEEAEALFRESSITYQEDLMFMGAPAFRFYVQAAFSYIHSDAAAGDSDIISCFVRILEHRLEFEAKELVAVAPQLSIVCRYIPVHYERFALTPEIYGDLRPRCQSSRHS